MLPLMALPALFQAGLGIFQTLKGARMNAERPQFKIPSNFTEGLQNARNRASSQMPGYQLAQNNIAKNASGAASGISQMGNSSSNKLAALAGVNQNSNNALNNLAAQSATFQNQQQQNLQGELNKGAEWQNKAWDYNFNQPYQNQAATKSALTGGGLKNIFGGLTGAASAGLAGGFGGGSAAGAGAAGATSAMPAGYSQGMGGLPQVNGFPQSFSGDWTPKGFNMY